MTRTYLSHKHLSIQPDIYLGYSYLILYKETALQRGNEMIEVYGLFLSDAPKTDELKIPLNEIHFPILLTEKINAIKLFTKIRSHEDIKEFEHSLERLVEND